MLDSPNLWHFEALAFIFPNLDSPVIFAAGCIYIYIYTYISMKYSNVIKKSADGNSLHNLSIWHI